MTAFELLDYCLTKRRECEFFGLPAPSKITFVVPRVGRGERMRVLPGLTGEILSVNAKNESIVAVDINRAEAYARRVMRTQERTDG